MTSTNNERLRVYATTSTMLIDRFTEKVIQPDKQLIESLHRLLDMIPSDNHALMIDHCVAQLLRLYDPNIHREAILPELILEDSKHDK